MHNEDKKWLERLWLWLNRKNIAEMKKLAADITAQVTDIRRLHRQFQDERDRQEALNIKNFKDEQAKLPKFKLIIRTSSGDLESPLIEATASYFSQGRMTHYFSHDYDFMRELLQAKHEYDAIRREVRVPHFLNSLRQAEVIRDGILHSRRPYTHAQGDNHFISVPADQITRIEVVHG